MRLCRPSFNIEPPFRLNPANLFDDPAAKPLSFSSAATHNGESDPNYRNCFLLRHFFDAIGLSDLLILPQAIYLGETLCSYISINNSSNFEVREVLIKVKKQKITTTDDDSQQQQPSVKPMERKKKCKALDKGRRRTAS
ncbi:hypothetical protein JHK86_025402 [Glycine max]|nr:hypothetical protein JHK86_025402 [Glycine max]